MGLTSRTLLDSAAKETEKLKNEVREQRCRQQREQRKKEDEQWEADHGISPSLYSTNTSTTLRRANTAPESYEMAGLQRRSAMEDV
jgi:hypothetical protein